MCKPAASALAVILSFSASGGESISETSPISSAENVHAKYIDLGVVDIWHRSYVRPYDVGKFTHQTANAAELNFKNTIYTL